MPKVDEIDFNGNSVAEETGQSENTETKEETTKETEVKETEVVETEETKETEDAESLKERLKKVEEEKENYKKGMLKYKELTLDKKEKQEEEEEQTEWDDNSKKFQKQTISRAEKIAKGVVEKNNETLAIEQFMEKYPDVKDSWDDIVSNYSPTNGKDSVKSVLKDLNRAYILTRYEKGEIDSLVSDALKKGEKKGKAEAQIADMSSVSTTTSKTVKGSNAISQGALKLAEKMRVDPKKLAEEDDSLTAEIKL